MLSGKSVGDRVVVSVSAVYVNDEEVVESDNINPSKSYKRLTARAIVTSSVF
jgi:hypothetical protein